MISCLKLVRNMALFTKERCIKLANKKRTVDDSKLMFGFKLNGKGKPVPPKTAKKKTTKKKVK